MQLHPASALRRGRRFMRVTLEQVSLHALLRATGRQQSTAKPSDAALHVFTCRLHGPTKPNLTRTVNESMLLTRTPADARWISCRLDDYRGNPSRCHHD
jgi:hypothetical protein